MFEKLKLLQKRSYAPYSYFRVSAILTTNNGKEFYGVNVENSSYGATICAERSAIVSAVSNGYTKGDFEKLYLLVDGDTISTPCNMCRQVFTEFFESNMEIVMYNKHGESKTLTVEDLCPYSFTSEDLK
ncbi:MAG: cytidine deaminase [Bacilli bacterium]|nr:cytidine deaminase [Bacilli bacterium]